MVLMSSFLVDALNLNSEELFNIHAKALLNQWAWHNISAD